jgi:hypothetical protein
VPMIKVLVLLSIRHSSVFRSLLPDLAIGTLFITVFRKSG